MHSYFVKRVRNEIMGKDIFWWKHRSTYMQVVKKYTNERIIAVDMISSSTVSTSVKTLRSNFDTFYFFKNIFRVKLLFTIYKPKPVFSNLLLTFLIFNERNFVGKLQIRSPLSKI